MARPIIAVDFDDVLTPHHEGLIAWYNKTYNTKLTLSHVHTFDPVPWGTNTVKDAIKQVHVYFDSDEFKAELPQNGAPEVLKKLSERYRLIVITGRDHILEVVTKEWLSRHYPGLFEAIHFTAQYSLEGENRSKSEIALADKISYFIDDSPLNVEEIAALAIPSILFGDYPWNQLDSLPAYVTRCNDWPAVEKYFEEVGEG